MLIPLSYRSNRCFVSSVCPTVRCFILLVAQGPWAFVVKVTLCKNTKETEWHWNWCMHKSQLCWFQYPFKNCRMNQRRPLCLSLSPTQIKPGFVSNHWVLVLRKTNWNSNVPNHGSQDSDYKIGMQQPGLPQTWWLSWKRAHVSTSKRTCTMMLLKLFLSRRASFIPKVIIHMPLTLVIALWLIVRPRKSFVISVHIHAKHSIDNLYASTVFYIVRTLYFRKPVKPIPHSHFSVCSVLQPPTPPTPSSKKSPYFFGYDRNSLRTES